MKFAYDAIHDLFHKYARGDSIDDWLIVNQALSSDADESQWRPLLQDVIARARG